MGRCGGAESSRNVGLQLRRTLGNSPEVVNQELDNGESHSYIICHCNYHIYTK